jgi:hypothetical protein
MIIDHFSEQYRTALTHQSNKILSGSYSVLSKAELYAKCKTLLFKPCADRSYCPGKDFWAESGRLAALAGRQQ